MTPYLINGAYENWWQCVLWIAQSNSDTDSDKRIDAVFLNEIVSAESTTNKKWVALK